MGDVGLHKHAGYCEKEQAKRCLLEKSLFLTPHQYSDDMKTGLTSRLDCTDTI